MRTCMFTFSKRATVLIHYVMTLRRRVAVHLYYLSRIEVHAENIMGLARSGEESTV